jgi:putative transposase
MNYTYKFRLYPNKEQQTKLAKHFGCCRWVYNYFLKERINFYEENKDKKKKSLSYNDNAKELTQLKKKFIWLNEVAVQCMQQSLMNLEKAHDRFFKRLSKFPKFKSKRDKQSSKFNDRVKVENNILYISNFREGIKLRLHRPIEGNIKQATVSKNPAGQYYVSILVERELDKLAPITKGIGLDLGIKTLAVSSDGQAYENPKTYSRFEKRLRLLNKAFSRTIKLSKGREKARLKLAKIYNKITNIRQDYLNKLSIQLVRENQTIIVEDLDVRGMLEKKNISKINKYINDACWYDFVTKLTDKCVWYGRQLIKVDRYFPSSKICSSCEYKNNDLKLSDRKWKCSNCQQELDRDLNAAINIKKEGLRKQPQELRG